MGPASAARYEVTAKTDLAGDRFSTLREDFPPKQLGRYGGKTTSTFLHYRTHATARRRSFIGIGDRRPTADRYGSIIGYDTMMLYRRSEPTTTMTMTPVLGPAITLVHNSYQRDADG